MNFANALRKISSLPLRPAIAIGIMEIKTLPDVASQTQKTNETYSGLAWVGMEKIQMPIQWEGQTLSAEIKAQVNLKPGTSRGIHMSRLYSLLSENMMARSIAWDQLEGLTEAFIQSQGELSQAAKLTLNFQLPLQRKALKSELKGWRLYPVQMEVVKKTFPSATEVTTTTERKMKVEILYSSTCPASTALSRELWKQDLKTHFTDEKNLTWAEMNLWFENQTGMPATPHAQRSVATVEVQLTDAGFDFGPQHLIDGLEKVLQTPVQTAVKRVDEQEFARINGQNTMFCEDAARKVQDWLNSLKSVKGYTGIFEHQESLHSHNAVAVIEKTSKP